MTRDEAIKVLRRTLFRDDKIPKELQELNEPCAGGWVDALVALGILKLDEPNANVIFHERMAEHYGLVNRESFLRKLDAAGLRIVEK